MGISVFRMDSTTYSQRVSEKISNTRKAAGMSVKALSDQSAIPMTTLDRKLRGGGDFSIREIKALALALKTTAAELTLIYDEQAQSAA